MIGKNHKAITQDALSEAGLKERALSFIVRANNDSDHLSSGLVIDQQHFSGDGSTVSIMKASSNFYWAALKFAAILVRRGSPKALTEALYFIGRALHCLQDFYAHSNWVALGHDYTWNGFLWVNLQFCKATPGDITTQLANTPLYRPSKGGFIPILGFGQTMGDIMGQKPYSERQSYERMKSRKLYHPELHLDYESSWASQVLRKIFKTESGFQRAKRLATEHTREVWGDFLNMTQRFPYSPEAAYSQNELRRYAGFFDRLTDWPTSGKQAVDRLKQHSPDDQYIGKLPSGIALDKLRQKFNQKMRITGKGKLKPLDPSRWITA